MMLKAINSMLYFLHGTLLDAFWSLVLLSEHFLRGHVLHRKSHFVATAQKISIIIYTPLGRQEREQVT